MSKHKICENKFDKKIPRHLTENYKMLRKIKDYLTK